MTTKLTMQCDGCGTRVETLPIRKTFVSVSGRSYGIGTWRHPDIDSAVAETGWQWSDPVTACTYCPKCWGEIERGEADETSQLADGVLSDANQPVQ